MLQFQMTSKGKAWVPWLVRYPSLLMFFLNPVLKKMEYKRILQRKKMKDM